MISVNEIEELRAKGRTKEFCLQVTPAFLGQIVDFLLITDLTFSQTSSILATISNILLINGLLRVSNTVVPFITSLIDKIEVPKTDYILLVPVYRLAFLILHDGTLEVLDTELNQLQRTLEQSYSTLDGQFHYNQSFLMVVIEILKALYSLYDKFSTRLKIGDILTTLMTRFVKSSKLMGKFPELTEFIRHLLNLIAILPLSEDVEFVSALITYLRTLEDVTETLVVFTIINKITPREISEISEISEVSEGSGVSEVSEGGGARETTESTESPQFTESGSLDSTKPNKAPDFQNIPPVTNSNKEILEPKTPKSPPNSSFILLQNEILPNDTDSILYNRFMCILGDFSSAKVVSLLQTSILQCFYCLCKKEIEPFLVLVGYLIAREFLDSNEIKLSPDVDLVKHMHPSSKYLTQDLDYSRLENDLVATMNKIAADMKNESPSNDMTMEEKEIEAERFFVIFDKMEKTGVFEGFKNPVREWQEQGRFENLDDEE
jgi:Guanine nucleotide exchange factor synembryn.